MDVKSASERLTQWRQELAQSPVPEAQRQRYSQAVEGFLIHIGEDPLKISSVKARQFMAEAIQKQVIGAHQVDTWKEALNWFFGWWRSASAPPPSRDVPPSAASDLGQTDWENQLISVIRRRHFSWRTEETYRGWAVRFARFLGSRPVREADEKEAKAFLDHLAVARRVSASTQRQALNAVVFLLREALGKNLGMAMAVPFAPALPGSAE